MLVASSYNDLLLRQARTECKLQTADELQRIADDGCPILQLM